MHSPVFDACQAVADLIREEFSQTGQLTAQWQDSQLGISDVNFVSDHYRRAHISVIDARSTHSLWLLHTTIFPHTHDGSPIYGFDIIAGPQKVSGAFHDFSQGGHGDHHMMQWFEQRTQSLSWNKPRPLPDWAKNIFSQNIVAIGAVRETELAQFCSLGMETLSYYLNHVGHAADPQCDYTQQHNYYCVNQRLNPHTPRVLMNIGFSQDQAIDFVNHSLFPLIDHSSAQS